MFHYAVYVIKDTENLFESQRDLISESKYLDTALVVASELSLPDVFLTLEQISSEETLTILAGEAVPTALAAKSLLQYRESARRWQKWARVKELTSSDDPGAGA